MMINPNDIEISNNFSVFKSLLKCNVCDGIVVDPVQCKNCDKVYCKKCINNINCVCKGEIKSNEILKEITSKLVVKCKFKCGELIPFNKYKEHIKLKCAKINFKDKFFNLNEKLICVKAKENELNKKIKKLNLNKANYSKEKISHFGFLIKQHKRCKINEREIKQIEDKISFSYSPYLPVPYIHRIYD